MAHATNDKVAHNNYVPVLLGIVNSGPYAGGGATGAIAPPR